MKIAIVIERMDISRGGRETSTAQIAAALAERSCDVTLLCQSGSWRHDGVETVLLGQSGLTRTGRLRNFAAGVRREIARRDFDIVHTMLPIPGANVYQPRGGTMPAQREASLRRRSIAGRWICRAVAPLNGFRRAMARMERRVTADDGVLCLAVSRMVADEFAHYYRRTGRVRVVYNAVDVPAGDAGQRARWRRQRRSEMGLTSDSVMFLTIVTNFKLKGVAETIAAFARWRHSQRRDNKSVDGRLVVVGGGQSERYRRYAHLRGVGTLVHFAGPTDAEGVSKWYAAADACVLLSWYDPCSRVVLEAARLGIPSITTAFNGAAEAIAGGAGIVVASPRDTCGVAAAMQTLADPQRRSGMAELCLQRSESLGIGRHVDELLAAYGEAAKAR